MKILSLIAACALAFIDAASAQCPAQWLPGDGIPGTNGFVYAAANWDPDGSGPQPPAVVVGGAFHVAGRAAANRIAVWNPGTPGEWSALGSGMNGDVRALLALPTGELIAGGSFTVAGGQQADRIARWDGTQWLPLGAGLNGEVRALAVLPNGDIIAGGAFTKAGALDATNIARWDGASWSPLGPGTNGVVHALAVLASGDLVAGGGFWFAGGLNLQYIARWDGGQWSGLGSGMAGGGNVRALAVLPNGDLIAGGDFTFAGGIAANRIARWDGQTWSALGSGLGSNSSDSVHALAVLPSGEIVAGGRFWTGSKSIASWNGAGWSGLAGGMGTLLWNFGVPPFVYALVATPEDDIIAGGTFQVAGETPANFIASWTGGQWQRLGTGFNDAVLALQVLPTGDLVAGGSFNTAGNTSAHRVALRNESGWTAMGLGLGFGYQHTYAAVHALTVLPTGDPVASGVFVNEPGVYFSGTSVWNGAQWDPLGLTGTVNALAVMPDGTLVAGGYSNHGPSTYRHILQFNGAEWSTLGGGTNGAVRTLALALNGDLIAGGQFTLAGDTPVSRIARWDGSSWFDLGAGVGGVPYPAVHALAIMPNGDVVAGGQFTTAGGLPASNIARWEGASWSPLGEGIGGGPPYPAVYALAVLPNGDLVAGGAFATAGGAPASNIARWNGSQWSPLGQGLNGTVHALAILPNGDIAAAGSFTRAGNDGSAYFARWSSRPPCYPNCDCSTVAPRLNIADFSCFLQKFAAGDLYANCDNSAIPPFLTIADFSCFLQRFALGCP